MSLLVPELALSAGRDCKKRRIMSAVSVINLCHVCYPHLVFLLSNSSCVSHLSLSSFPPALFILFVPLSLFFLCTHHSTQPLAPTHTLCLKVNWVKPQV